ncbi:hypothetical protein EV385_3066 [Krasilnikovia cinnamomea]|uniref:Uncharacterized protein n=1 Tax=Krasilnikovia cinnamomea TaxID=349313 RepID=A0A4V2G753_9ACTN|nr:hypothetical protein [Krasilnikovia cinnamomea]RZU51256.1 hypothetical protein EV385_3066 [Krasilnikovia cinnamomea]
MLLRNLHLPTGTTLCLPRLTPLQRQVMQPRHLDGYPRDLPFEIRECRESTPTDQPPDSPPTGTALAAPDSSRTAGLGPPIALTEINSGRFTFHAFGATSEHDRDALTAAWLQHVADTGADLDCFAREDINVIEGGYGRAFRKARRTRKAVTPRHVLCARFVGSPAGAAHIR